MTLWGWKAIIEYTGLNDQLIRRAIGHYGFPPPVKVRQGSKVTNVWDEPSVHAWMNRSENLYFMQSRRAVLKDGASAEDRKIYFPAEGKS